MILLLFLLFLPILLGYIVSIISKIVILISHSIFRKNNMDDYNYDELSRSLMKNEIAKIVIVNNDIIEIEFIQENSTTKKDNKKMLYSKNLFEVVYSNYLNKKTNNEGNVIITREKRPKVDELLKELVSIGLLIMIGYFVLIFIYSEMPISKDKKISKFLVNEKKMM